jgi:hypothetical protein
MKARAASKPQTDCLCRVGLSAGWQRAHNRYFGAVEAGGMEPMAATARSRRSTMRHATDGSVPPRAHPIGIAVFRSRHSGGNSPPIIGRRPCAA